MIYLTITTCRLYNRLQTSIGQEIVDEQAMSERWDDLVTDIWGKLSYDRNDSPDSSMTVPLDLGVTYFPHENKWGLQMDSLEIDLHNWVENKMSPQELEELNVSTLAENDHNSVESEEVPVSQNQPAATAHVEQISK